MTSITRLGGPTKSSTYLSNEQLLRALELRDLSDPSQGSHAMQIILDGLVRSLTTAWSIDQRIIRTSPIVPVSENYDRLGYHRNAVTRAERYTRYLGPTVMLRSHTSAAIPSALDDYADRPVDATDLRSDSTLTDELLVIPGLVHRRDAVDRHHVGVPHQVDLWRLRSRAYLTSDDLEVMIAEVVESVLPGAQWRMTTAHHPYTVHGRQVDVRLGEEWLELAECGLIHPAVLAGSGLDPGNWSGLALGMGLDRALMLRKSIPDIRYLRSIEPRIADQMQDLTPWPEVSALPAATRDISIVVNAAEDEETLGDRIRTVLGADTDIIESAEVLSRTAATDLPGSARTRLRIEPDQANVLLRIVLRPLERTLTAAQANDLRNRIYLGLHEGPVAELIDT